MEWMHIQQTIWGESSSKLKNYCFENRYDQVDKMLN